MAGGGTPIIDAQVHAYERDHEGRPWWDVLHGPPEVTGDDMVAAMDDVGVDAAILVSPWTMYRWDASYAIDVHAANPDRFALVKPVNPADEAVGDTIAAWAETPGAVAVRIMMVRGVSPDPADPGVNRVLAEAGRHGLPVNLLCWGRLAQVDALAARHPNTRLVIDHLGLSQPFEPPPPADPWIDVPGLVRVAANDNIALKVTGACTLAHQPFPYPDIWPHLHRILEAFGLDRCMWGTDWTRAVELLDYRSGVDAFLHTEELSDTDRAKLMGGTLQRIYDWFPTGRA